MQRYEALRPYDGEPYFLHSEWQELHSDCKQKVLENPGTWIRRRWGISLPVFSILAVVRMGFVHAPQLCANVCMLFFVPVTNGYLERLAWVSVLYHTLVYGVGLITLFSWSLWHLLAESKDSAFFAMLFVLPPHHFFRSLGWIVRADHNEEMLAKAWGAANSYEHESRAEMIRSLLHVLLCTDRIFVASVYIFLLNPFGLEEYANFVDPVLLTICWITAGAMQAREGLHFWTVAALVMQSLGTVSFCAFIGHTRGLTPGGASWDQAHGRRLFLQHVKFLAFAFAADGVIFSFGYGGARFHTIAIFLVPPVLLAGATSFVLLFDMFMNMQHEDSRCNCCCIVAVMELILVLFLHPMRESAGGAVTNGLLVVTLLGTPMVLTGCLMQRVGFAGGGIGGDSLSDVEAGAADDGKDALVQSALSADSSQGSQVLRVTIVAVGCASCASSHEKQETLEDLHVHCVCEIQDKPFTQFRTDSTSGTGSPVWNHVQVVGGFVKGDVLVFSVYGTNTKEQCNLIGKAMLTSDRIFPSGFQGELFLAGTGMQGSPLDSLTLTVFPAELTRQEETQESSEPPELTSKLNKGDAVEVATESKPPCESEFGQHQGSKATCWWCPKWSGKH